MAESTAGQIFTDEDVRRVLEEERGEGGSQGGWSLANQSENVEVYRKSEEGVSVHLLKASADHKWYILFVCVCVLCCAVCARIID